ncbi:glutamyl-tRNA amidotransferase subunit A [Podospora appendiculata]|uniref:Glutamyl-tRNA amidotransferase subunit A n=1 Tax=Podospora appendiculata TaxID=314037 RepID=A0AAE1C8L7_9PEZI|nr:glutamyl-tRNA amidotransferase subunit A [Podospora appendiculata]
MAAKKQSEGLPSLLHLTIEEAAEGLQSGRFTSVDLTKAYLARIDEASEFRAVLQINPDALIVAQQQDDERVRLGNNGRGRGPLHGVPILVKDNVATKDNLDVSAGSLALLGAKPAVESSVIAKLREAGVLVLGTTNMSEWANFRGMSVSSGWSPRGGQTLGAYHPNSNPSGSSSGSAVAAALGLSTAAIGTETSGSIVEPAEFNNVVGFKPSRGIIGNDGAVPISGRQDVIGTLTQTVKDAAYLFTNMAGRSERDEGTWNIPFDTIPDFSALCNGTDLSGITIGVPRNTFSADRDPTSPVMISFEAALKILNSAGAKVVDSADFPKAEGYQKLINQGQDIVCLCAEFKRDIARYLQALETNPNQIHSAEDIIEFIKTTPAEEYPDRDMDIFLLTQAEDIDVSSDRYKERLELELFFGGEGGILGAMEKHGLDLLVVPSSRGMAVDLAAIMGFPVLGVPLGFFPQGTPVKHEDKKPNLVREAPGMPYSLTFMSKSFSDGVLLRVGYAFEQLSRVRADGPLPFKMPTTELKDV